MLEKILVAVLAAFFISFFVISNLIPLINTKTSNSDNSNYTSLIDIDKFINSDVVETSIELFEKDYSLEYSFDNSKLHFFREDNIINDFLNNADHSNEKYNHWKVINLYQVENTIILEIDKNL